MVQCLLSSPWAICLIMSSSFFMEQDSSAMAFLLPPVTMLPFIFVQYSQHKHRTLKNLPHKCLTWCSWYFKIMEYVKISLSISPSSGVRIKNSSFRVTLLRKRSGINSIIIKTHIMSFLHRLHMLSMTIHSAVVLINIQMWNSKGWIELADCYFMIWEIDC